MPTHLHPGSLLDDARATTGLPAAGARGGRSRRSRHADTYWQRSTAHVTPVTLICFVGAAIAFQRSALHGDTDRDFTIGVLLLALSILVPLTSRVISRVISRPRGHGDPMPPSGTTVRTR